jgi:hypothetical protein
MRFSLGQIVATRNAVAELERLDVNPLELLQRHSVLDQGCLDDEDHRLNQQAVQAGDRILSAYEYSGVKFWVITEHDRSVTTILLPQDY